MRLTRPKNWIFMSPEEQQRWAEKAGKGIEEANRIVKQRIEDMKKDGKFKENKKIDSLLDRSSENKMEWFPGGIF
jgi:hypothetical protein